jgi:ankyrin repeat protein
MVLRPYSRIKGYNLRTSAVTDNKTVFKAQADIIFDSESGHIAIVAIIDKISQIKKADPVLHKKGWRFLEAVLEIGSKFNIEELKTKEEEVQKNKLKIGENKKKEKAWREEQSGWINNVTKQIKRDAKKHRYKYRYAIPALLAFLCRHYPKEAKPFYEKVLSPLGISYQEYDRSDEINNPLSFQAEIETCEDSIVSAYAFTPPPQDLSSGNKPVSAACETDGTSAQFVTNNNCTVYIVNKKIKKWKKAFATEECQKTSSGDNDKEQGHSSATPRADILRRRQAELGKDKEKWLDPLHPVAIPLVGRAEEIRRLDGFIADGDLFKVWGIKGRSGAGKTRLTVHWMLNSPWLKGWELWRAGAQEHSPDFWQKWQPSCPTLIIIDYMFGFNEAVGVIIKKYACSDYKGPKLRLLVIDHLFSGDLLPLRHLADDDRWLEGQEKNDTSIGGYFFGSQPLDLNRTSDQDYIIHNIIRNLAGDRVPPERIAQAESLLGGSTVSRLTALRVFIDNMTKEDKEQAYKTIKTVLSDGPEDISCESLEPEEWERRLHVLYGENEHPFDAFLEDIRKKSPESGGLSRNHPLREYDAYEGKLRNAWHPLYAALVGHALANVPPGSDFPAFGTTRRDLIATYLRDSERMPWKPGENNVVNRLACYYIAAATAKRGLPYALLGSCAGENNALSEKDYISIRKICRHIVSSDDERDLHPLEPDILGETLVLLVLKLLDGMPENYGQQFRSMLTAGDEETQIRGAIEFVGFSERLARNLANDGRYAADTVGLWDVFLRFLQPGHFPERSTMRWAVSVACIAVAETMKERGFDNDFHMLMKRVEDKALARERRSELIYTSVSFVLKYREYLCRYGDAKKMQALPGYVQDILEEFGNRADNDLYPTILLMACDIGCPHVAMQLVPLYAPPFLNPARSVFRLCKEKLFGGSVHKTRDKNLEAALPGGETALILASRCGYTDLAQKLIAGGADVNRGDLIGSTAMIYASAMGHEETVRLLIANDAKIGKINRFRKTALMAAAFSGHESIVRLLLSFKNAKVGAVDYEGRTALIMTACNGHVEAGRLLIKAGEDVDHPDSDGMTALFYACQNGRKDFVRLLIDSDARLDQSDRYGMTALMHACFDNHTDIARMLLGRAKTMIDSTEGDGCTALIIAAEYGHPEMTQLLLDSGARIDQADKDDRTALMWSCRGGYTKVAQVIINKDKSALHATDKQKGTALIAAVEGRYADTVQFLLENGAGINDSDIHGNTSLIWACINGDEATVRVFIEKGADINLGNSEDMTPLIMAAYFSCEPVTHLLLDNKADVNKDDIHERTALHMAAYNGNAAIVRLLLDHDANIDAEDRLGDTALMLACQQNHEHVVRILLENKAKIDAKDMKGRTALMFAVSKGYITIVRLLLDDQAIVDAEDNYYATALMLACLNDEAEIAALLIEREANVNKPNHGGQTPLMAACIKGNYKIADLLIRSGAKINFISGDGNTALMLAIRSNQNPEALETLWIGLSVEKRNQTASEHEAIIRLLLEKEADVNQVDEEGRRTALIFACAENQENVVSMLIERKADIHHKDIMGWTPLMVACSLGKENIVAMLIKDRKNINEINNEGLTALMIAVNEGHKNVVRMLIQSGADIHIKCPAGYTARRIALKTGDIEILKIFLQAVIVVPAKREE